MKIGGWYIHMKPGGTLLVEVDEESVPSVAMIPVTQALIYRMRRVVTARAARRENAAEWLTELLRTIDPIRSLDLYRLWRESPTASFQWSDVLEVASTAKFIDKETQCFRLPCDHPLASQACTP